jgi:hypothetical protein
LAPMPGMDESDAKSGSRSEGRMNPSSQFTR